ncbi:MAG: 50S ribosomal protein L9 [Candidatus Kerfeldbacteria bacterium]|nr:50S ribosomal protein L9 [Candidatus Kerfeldbacteria bacterium]
MEVLFLSDVPGSGHRGEIKDVTEGYARNFLLPRRLATRVTDQSRRQYQLDLQKRQHQIERAAEDERTFVSNISGSTVQIRVKANDQGRLFQGIDRHSLAEAIYQQLKYRLKPDHIGLQKPIKEVGTYSIPIFIGSHQANLSVVIQT